MCFRGSIVQKNLKVTVFKTATKNSDVMIFKDLYSVIDVLKPFLFDKSSVNEQGNTSISDLKMKDKSFHSEQFIKEAFLKPTITRNSKAKAAKMVNNS